MKMHEQLRRWYEDYGQLPSIPLWPEGAPGFREEHGQPPPSLAIIQAREGAGPRRGIILVLPGGGFVTKAPYEGRVVADRFARDGFDAALLDYRVSPYTQHDALEDAWQAVRMLHATWEKVAVLGFSAGGHYAALAGTRKPAEDPARPDAVVVCYSGLSFSSWPPEKSLHELGGVHTQADRRLLSPERHIGSDTPPFFIWHTASDQRLHVLYPLGLAAELAKWEIPFELHIYPEGAHGIGLADGSSPQPADAHVGTWIALCQEWLEDRGF